MTYCTRAQRRKRTKPPPQKQTVMYRQLWRLIDGAIADCIHHHPEYFRDHDLGAVRGSIAKRITGAVLSCASIPAWGRSGDAPAIETAAPHRMGDAASEREPNARRSVCEAGQGGGVVSASATSGGAQ